MSGNEFICSIKEKKMNYFCCLSHIDFMHVQLISEKIIYSRSRTLTVENWHHLLNLRVPGFPESSKKHSCVIVNLTHSSS